MRKGNSKLQSEERKLQGSIPKLQGNSKVQVSTPKAFGVVACGFPGPWCLVFGAYLIYVTLPAFLAQDCLTTGWMAFMFDA